MEIINSFLEHYKVDEVIAKHKALDQKLTDKHVVTIAGTAARGYYLVEQCDENYFYHLTLDDCRELYALFGDMADALSEVNNDC